MSLMQLLSTVFCISNQTRTNQALEMQRWHLAFTANLSSSAHKFYSYLCTLGILLSSLFLSVWLVYFLCWWQSSEELSSRRIPCPHNHVFLRILHMFSSLFHSKIYDQLQLDYHEICYYIRDPQRINLLIIYWPHVVHTSQKIKRSPVNTKMIMSWVCCAQSWFQEHKLIWIHMSSIPTKTKLFNTKPMLCSCCLWHHHPPCTTPQLNQIDNRNFCT